jgi:hypothetical protein
MLKPMSNQYASRLPVDSADRIAEAYSRKPPRYRVITETYGLAVMLFMNRNTSHDQAVWLVHGSVSEALCGPAEQFAQVLCGRSSPDDWRGGALAGLRTLAGGNALHEVTEPWPWTPKGEPPEPVKRFWVDDSTDDWDWRTHRKTYSPLRMRVLAELAGRPRMAEAWDALWNEWNRDPTYSERQRGRYIHRCQMAGWSSLHERPSDTRWLRDQLLGKDPDAEAEYLAAAQRGGAA